jgi:2-keto-4-pentenoate hydratase/2-oxohepta-3-ene-1,7-dioic acid hydratase in catechol pathway
MLSLLRRAEAFGLASQPVVARALLPGDLIACGTSLGVLPMRPGAEVSVRIGAISTLTNRFAAAETTPG